MTVEESFERFARNATTGTILALRKLGGATFTEADRRAERTCRMEYNERWSHDEYYPTECYNCSECGHMTYDGVPTFCPNCGARVVEEARDDADR